MLPLLIITLSILLTTKAQSDEADRAQASPTWVKFCLLQQKVGSLTLNRLLVTNGFPSGDKRVKYTSDADNCWSSTFGQCAYVNMVDGLPPCVLGSLSPFENSTLICESLSNSGYAYSRCDDNVAMRVLQGQSTFQNFQPIGYFTKGWGCGNNKGYTNVKTGGTPGAAATDIDPVIAVSTPSRTTVWPTSDIFSAKFCGPSDYPSLTVKSRNPGAPSVVLSAGVKHIFDNRKSSTALLVDLSQSVEGTTTKTLAIDSTKSSSMTQSWGWSIDVSLSAKAGFDAGFASVEVGFEANAGYSSNEQLQTELSNSESNSQASSVTATKSMTGKFEVPAYTQYEITEVISTTIQQGMILMDVTDAAGVSANQALALISKESSVVGYTISVTPGTPPPA